MIIGDSEIAKPFKNTWLEHSIGYALFVSNYFSPNSGSDIDTIKQKAIHKKLVYIYPTDVGGGVAETQQNTITFIKNNIKSFSLIKYGVNYNPEQLTQAIKDAVNNL